MDWNTRGMISSNAEVGGTLHLPDDASLYRAWPGVGSDDEETRMARPAELASIRRARLAA